jgi:hypothetical protein
MLVNRTNAESIILGAARRPTLVDSVAWIGDGHPLTAGTELSALLQALLLIGGGGASAEAAVRRIVQEASRSDFDSAAIILAPEWLPSLAELRRVLETLAQRSPDGTLRSLNAQTVLAAQRVESSTVQVLCLIAGMPYRDLRERADDIPSAAEGPWDRESVARAFEVIDSVVRGDVTTEVEGALPMQPIELLLPLGRTSGWDDIQRFFEEGVPYETLLAQRAVGTGWGAHRNRTSSRVNYPFAAALASELDQRGIDYRLSTSVGGDAQPSALEELAGSGRQLGLAALSRDRRPVIGVVFSSARDGGTARANIGGLMGVADARIPVAAVLSGRGWAQRGETVQLARALEGRIYTAANLSTLADDIATMTR